LSHHERTKVDPFDPGDIQSTLHLAKKISGTTAYIEECVKFNGIEKKKVVGIECRGCLFHTQKVLYFGIEVK
jgi:hypothetical protein